MYQLHNFFVFEIYDKLSHVVNFFFKSKNESFFLYYYNIANLTFKLKLNNLFMTIHML